MRNEAEKCLKNKQKGTTSSTCKPNNQTFIDSPTKDREKDLLDDLDHLEKNILSDNDEEAQQGNSNRPSPPKLERKFSKNSILPLTPKKSSKKSFDSPESRSESPATFLVERSESTQDVKIKIDFSEIQQVADQGLELTHQGIVDLSVKQEDTNPKVPQTVKIGSSEYKVVENSKFENPITQNKMLTTVGYVIKNKPNSRCKSYICSYCDKSFNKKWDVERHVRYIHTKIKPYECKVCHKKFAEPGALNKHAKRH